MGGADSKGRGDWGKEPALGSGVAQEGSWTGTISFIHPFVHYIYMEAPAVYHALG